MNDFVLSKFWIINLGYLLFSVNLNEKDGNRNILAGLGEYYNPEDLVNKKVLVVTNLQPKKMAGHESNGMILAYKDKNETTGEVSYKVIEMDNSANVGSPVS